MTDAYTHTDEDDEFVPEHCYLPTPVVKVRRYALKFDDGRVEYVDAIGPTQAVEGLDPKPHTITDLTAVRNWLDRERPNKPTPLNDRMERPL